MQDDIGLIDAATDPDVMQLALSGLLSTPKTLPAKLFYDEAGCRLFERITALPEYYLTRTERALLAEAAPRIMATMPPGCVLVEYGASDEAKALTLLRERDAAGRPAFAAYVPIDVAAPALAALQRRLHGSRPDLPVHAIAADFEQRITLPDAVAGRARLGFFPGSTIGNLAPDAAYRFFAMAGRTLGPGSLFLVGADLRKDPATLLAAYDDAAGVTASFNRNLLVRLNREAGCDFDVQGFAHRAVWNDGESRIEMHLVSRRGQKVRCGNRTIGFAPGETIHTENSYKHTPERFAALAAAGGWRLRQTWTDAAGLFALYLLAIENPAYDAG
jgi:dimethylhistidine N-methyltransferase